MAQRETTDRTAARAPAPAAGPGPLTDLGLLIGRAVVGFIIAAHGWQKLTDVGPATFGSETLAGLGVPFPTTMGYVVTFTELAGGLLLIAGLLTRFAAFALIVNLAVAIMLVKATAPLNFNPAVLVLRGLKRPLVYRFYYAFQHAKHGRTDYLERLERDLFEHLGN